MQARQLPLSLGALSDREKSRLAACAWQELNQPPAGSDASFFLLNGSVVDQKHNIISDSRLLGLHPFQQQDRPEYSSDQCQLALLPAEELARFYLQNPAARRSFLKLEENSALPGQRQTLPAWQKQARVFTVLSDRSAAGGVHFAASLAFFSAKAQNENKRVIYLEWQRESYSLYSLSSLEEPNALVQTVNLAGEPIEEALAQRIVPLSGQVDSLNIQHMSLWEMEPESWAAVYEKLRQQYDIIVCHAGLNRPLFLLEQSDLLFYFSSSAPVQTPPLEEGMLPPVLVIAADEKANGLYYPEQEVKQQGSWQWPQNLPESHALWQWFEKNLQQLLFPRKVVYIGHCPTSARLAHFLANAIDRGEISPSDLVIAEGFSALWLTASVSGLPQIAGTSRPVSLNWLAEAKPVYPQSGIFSAKAMLRQIQGFLSSRQNLSFLYPVVADGSVQFLSGFDLAGHWPEILFPLAFLQNDLPESHELPLRKKRPAHAANSLYWQQIQALLFRYGAESIDFYYFPVSAAAETKGNSLAEIMISDFFDFEPAAVLAGKNTRLQKVY